MMMKTEGRGQFRLEAPLLAGYLVAGSAIR